MMQAAVTPALKKEFAFAAAMREEDVLYREKMLRLDARQRVMREDERIKTEKRDRETFDSVRATFASERQIVEYRARLDRYDEKTVEALTENRIALEEVQKRLDDLLGKAHVLPDGRRVFKTEDGTRVFDEAGVELNATVIDPSSVGDWHPRWEQYKPELDEKDRLIKERVDLHEFQAKSDAAREELDKGHVTAERLDELDADLKDAMPESVRRKLGNEGPTRNAEGPSQEPSNGVRPATTNPNERQPSGLTPM